VPRTRERSAGAVVYWEGPGRREYLLLRYGPGYWGFPKGHVEKGETDLQAAYREVEEETGISKTKLRLIDGFRVRTAYKFRRGKTLVDKVVDYFLLASATKDVTISSEHTAFAWLGYDEALKQVSFDASQQLLRDAEAFIAAEGLPPRP
jgi:8-oxo-dGTP pyrophosphatase MutT (NUDIX family)